MKPKEQWIVCRVCLQQPTGLQSIFLEEEEDLIKMIAECGGVPIQKFDHYPDKICNKCLKHLRVAYKFRITCQRSYKHLSRFIAPVKVEPDKSESPETIEKEPNSKSPEQQSECDETIEIDEEDIEELEMKVEPEDVVEESSVKEEVADDNLEDIGDMFLVEDDEDFIMLDSEDVPSDTEYLDEVEKELLDIPSEKEFIQEEKVQKQTQPKVTRQNKSAGKRGATKKTYAKTQKLKRPKESSFICDICGNIYSTQGRLNEHLKVHKGVKPYDCEICGHAFAQTQQLSRHMNTHTGNRPYKCSYCPAAFADLSTRNKHHRIHTNERPYVCDVCNKSFTYTNTLKIHKMIHTGEKPHVCDICGKGFPQAYKLRNHRITHVKRGHSMQFNENVNYVQVESCETEEEENEILNLESTKCEPNEDAEQVYVIYR